MALIRREVVPAVGCTEPAAVALAVAKAVETLGASAARVDVGLSGNILKNAMGVGIPGTGMIGLPIAVALGALIGRSAYGLEVLKDVDDVAVERAKRLIDEQRIRIGHIGNTPSNLHIEVKVSDEQGNTAEAVISGTHTNCVYVAKNAEVLLDKRRETTGDTVEGYDNMKLDLPTVWDFALTTPIEEIDFILDAMRLNTNAARLALDGKGKGHGVGATLRVNRHKMGDSVLADMLTMTSAACDARMAGEPVAVMSNSGSGNQGIAITMPVVTYARHIDADRDTLVRALTMAHLTSIYIKQQLGRLSALCGCVVASTGASMALVYLMGGDYARGSYAVKNMIATLTGMICDGAKPACSLKITSGVGTAYISALMAMNNHCVTSTEGIIDDCVDRTISNFALIGREAMTETDRVVLSIMAGGKGR